MGTYKLSKHTIGVMLREYENGMKLDDIANKYKVTGSAVMYHVNKYGVKKRFPNRKHRKTLPETPVPYHPPINASFINRIRFLFTGAL